ncbi:tissue factor pathway inhibitor a isoform X1 [Maylandia zebra]|uniref:Tissue factor pathway inhibitor n=2 Tax=Haplochromini TaxID=319058 RepID=A0A3P9CCU7_9CICH|nr:tissue factor pathway inhibitor [Maylandia zebra]XP_026000906.1 tissue factor pathway inhibitor-like [Astatotilapia calliptera]
MPLSNKWWILCAVLLSCLVRFGSCRKAHGVPAEPVIFSELCALKDEPGPCRAIKDRYFFNVDSGRCELFEYGGCGGNQNNFETLEECEETCLVSDKKNPCHLPQAPGPCRGLVSRFFFDSSSQECKQFYYGGCFGNANNFRTMAECQAKCLNPAPESPSPRKDDVQPIIETGEQIAGEQIANAPLVQGNDTNPETNELCFRPVDKGTCSGSESRYAYIPEKKRCQSFSYSGCGGNENNFITRRHCFHKCIRKGHGKRMMIRVRRKNLHNILNYSRRTLDSA